MYEADERVRANVGEVAAGWWWWCGARFLYPPRGGQLMADLWGGFTCNLWLESGNRPTVNDVGGLTLGENMYRNLCLFFGDLDL